MRRHLDSFSIYLPHGMGDIVAASPELHEDLCSGLRLGRVLAQDHHVQVAAFGAEARAHGAEELRATRRQRFGP